MKDLPNEIINKILLFRESHPIANILKHLINNYNDYNKDFDEDDNTPFNYYVLELSDQDFIDILWLKGYRIRRKNNLSHLRCGQCSKWFELYDKYLINTIRNSFHCFRCLGN